VQFTFKHILIRDVGLRPVPRGGSARAAMPTCAQHRGDVAKAAGTLATILAHHWREAGEPARAIPYLLAAADAARRAGTQAAVVDLYSMRSTRRRTMRGAEDSLDRGIALVELARLRPPPPRNLPRSSRAQRQEKLDR
jgi:hypothetical protein